MCMAIVDVKRRVQDGLDNGALLPVPDGTELVSYASGQASCALCEQPLPRGAIQIEFRGLHGPIPAHRECFGILWEESKGRWESL